MKKISTYDSSAPPTQENSAIIVTILQKLINLQIDTSIASELIKNYQTKKFHLGDELIQNEFEINNFIYLVCQGRVRILAFDSEQQEEIPVDVLETGEIFGGDNLFTDKIKLYRAIAASQGQIAKIDLTQLQLLLEKLPQLEQHLQEQTQQRQCQIFLKTCTEWRSLPSHQLRPILPHFQQIQVPAGEQLTTATPGETAHYWLNSGQISTTQTEIPTFPSWGYPDKTPTDWQAETQLSLYKLPKQKWNELISLLTNPNKAPLKKSVTIHSPQVTADTPPPTSENSQSPPTENKVPFPKPINRRLLDIFAHYPIVLQQSSSDCGAACLGMISQYWGKRFSINQLRNLANVGRSGASLKNLAKAAESLGFQSRPVRASLSRLEEQTDPWVAHWEGIHYLVVYKIKSKRILIADPAIGKKWLSRSEFLASWSGYALLLQPTQEFRNAKPAKTSLGNFANVLWPYRNTALQIILASILIQVFGIVSPLFTQIIIDQVVVNKSLSALNVFVLGGLIFGLGGLALGTTRQYLLDYFSNRVDLTLISGFISHALRLPLKFFESRRVGDIITRVQENQKIQRFLIRQVVMTWLDFLTGMVYLGLMLYYNYKLTLLVLALIPPIAILTLVATPFLRQVSREVFNAAADQNSSLVEMMTGISTVKATATEKELRWRWEEDLTKSLNARFKAQKLGNTLQFSSGVVNSLGSTALLWFGAFSVIQGELSIGQFMAFNMMIGKVITPFMTLVNLWDELQEVWISVERLNDVLSAEPEETPGQEMLVLPRLRGEVRFDNVTFRYDEDQEKNTLQNISFDVRPGQTIAIVGRSGSGKSTLVSLLQGLYYPNNGRILIDGHDIRHISPQSLRSQLGVVPQECFLFSGTILENISMYADDVALPEVIEVAKLAEAHSFIQDLPLGYNTKVGERGSSLSGGQRQRVAIARALLGEPRIVILDEATSSLDTESERRFQENLARISRERTTFIIAHRLSTVRNADQILVIDKGILLEQGTHEELIVLGGLYYHLAQQQLDL
ncbi:ABC transporter transmembrane domain-containing protein [Dapis sp. BLCC M126]|uniref:ABC transporter transmembrane domain-containing protein n=1 Tax=Dapis sp. BLCC M126 TaxID=3400189 RepID=UPI003CF88005